jgi:hypothetical protein
MAQVRGSQVTQIYIFKQIWMRSNKKSFISGLFLREFENSLFFLNLFAHVLPKAQNKYPYFKYYARNIVLLTPGEHALYDQATEEKRIQYSLDIEEQTNGRATADWGKLKALEEELREEYKKYFPKQKNGIFDYKYSVDEQLEIIGELNRAFFSGL